MRDDWKKCAELLDEGATITQSRARGFTVELPCGSTQNVPIPGGLSEVHYNFLAPHISDKREKALLALGVIENELQPISWADWMETQRILYDKFEDFEEWLLQGISKIGIGRMASMIRDWWAKFRRTNPATRMELVVKIHPSWDSSAGILSFGSKPWRFRLLRGGPLMQVLDEFERCNWKPSVTLENLFDDQVRDVAKELRKKTEGAINWTASGCTVGWLWGDKRPNP